MAKQTTSATVFTKRLTNIKILERKYLKPAHTPRLTFFLQLISCTLRTSKLYVQILSLEIWDISLFVRPIQIQWKIWNLKLSVSYRCLPNFPIDIFKQDEVQYFTRLNGKKSERISNKTSSNGPYMAQKLHQTCPSNFWFTISNGDLIPFAALQHTILQRSVHQVDSGRKLQKPSFGNHFDE